jgi:photosystem II stability/assembly factor-like uncharacterized protein
MQRDKWFLSFLLMIMVANVQAQLPTIKIVESGNVDASIRGLSVVNDKVIWASGSKGSVARSKDGGVSWDWIAVPGYEQRDFRDIEAFDDKTAIIMGVAEPAIILKTKDGGKTWVKVLEDSTKGMFLDAMDFADEKHGIVVGDPILNYAYVATTDDGGDHWIVNTEHLTGDNSVLQNGEAFFASSGTNVKMNKVDKAYPFYFVTGGTRSRFFSVSSQQINPLPFSKTGATSGANSLAIFDNKKGVIVGGDFSKDSINTDNCLLFTMASLPNFTTAKTPPHGYRSSVIYVTENILVSCGTSGIDVSNDGGQNWQLISKESFHVCQKAKKGSTVYLAGVNGKIARLTVPKRFMNAK